MTVATASEPIAWRNLTKKMIINHYAGGDRSQMRAGIHRFVADTGISEEHLLYFLENVSIPEASFLIIQRALKNNGMLPDLKMPEPSKPSKPSNPPKPLVASDVAKQIAKQIDIAPPSPTTQTCLTCERALPLDQYRQYSTGTHRKRCRACEQKDKRDRRNNDTSPKPIETRNVAPLPPMRPSDHLLPDFNHEIAGIPHLQDIEQALMESERMQTMIALTLRQLVDHLVHMDQAHETLRRTLEVLSYSE